MLCVGQSVFGQYKAFHLCLMLDCFTFLKYLIEKKMSIAFEGRFQKIEQCSYNFDIELPYDYLLKKLKF